MQKSPINFLHTANHNDWDFPGDSSGKEPTCQLKRHKRHGFSPWVRKIPWRRAWQPTPVVTPGESHGQRSLAGFSPWGRKESHKNERLTLSLSPSLLRLCVSYTHGASLS